MLTLALGWFALSQAAQAQDGDEGNFDTAEGFQALHTYITTAGHCRNDTAIGYQTLFNNTTGEENTAIGASALTNNTAGAGNTANGWAALNANTTGSLNTADGFAALDSNTTGGSNTATGVSALTSNTTGSDNTATGASALAFNTADNNTATGFNALFSNTTGGNNTATGVGALFSNTTGFYNTANGLSALNSNTTGGANTATGVSALVNNTTGSNNTATGLSALHSNTTGGTNIALGANAGGNLTTGSNNIDIGNLGVAGEANTIRVGTKGTQKATYIAGISGATVAGGVGVIISTSGRLGTVSSSARFKEEIKPMDKASEAILALEPVTFRYKEELDPEKIPQFGLIAEDVEKVNPDLVARDEEGKVNTVRYEAVNAMLLNEFLKEHQKVEKLECTVAMQEKDFKATIAQQQKQIEALTATVQKVSDQVALSKPAPQLVANR